MFEGYRVVSVTPAGRKEHLEILNQYLLRNSHIIDEHHFWVNTTVESDINYMKSVCASNPFFKFIECCTTPKAMGTIYTFFPACIEEDTIYIRFDDDICFIAPDAVQNLLRARIKHPDYFVVYPHIVNNKMNMLSYSPIRAVLQTNDYYKDLEHVAKLHEYCLSLKDWDNLKGFSFATIEGFNINSFCWFGSEFAKFGGVVAPNEEHWISEIGPALYGKKNFVCGDSVVIHFAYLTQREYLKRFDYLDRYRELAISYL